MSKMESLLILENIKKYKVLLPAAKGSEIPSSSPSNRRLLKIIRIRPESWESFEGN
jgi:hypothetical protein